MAGPFQESLDEFLRGIPVQAEFFEDVGIPPELLCPQSRDLPSISDENAVRLHVAPPSQNAARRSCLQGWRSVSVR